MNYVEQFYNMVPAIHMYTSNTQQQQQREHFLCM